MFFSPGLEQLDPALLAFVKCHVTSPTRWEVLRALANQDGVWITADELARTTHRSVCEVREALTALASDGVVDVRRADRDATSYRLPGDEPTSVVLHRLIQAATQSQELRAIIAAHLLSSRWASAQRAAS